MNNEVKLFESEEFGKVRTYVDEQGEIWFVAKDVAEALGYSESSLETVGKLVQNVPEEWRGRKPFPVEWKGVQPMRTPSGTQEMITLSEQGLYFFLGRSDKPKALPYQKWIAGEVMPAIRKTGGYQIPTREDIPQPLTLEDQTGSLIRFYSFYYPDKNQVALAVNKSVRKISGMDMLALGEVELVAPMQEQLLTPTEIGSLLSPQISPRAVNALLADAQLQRKVCGKWEPTEKGEAFGGVLLDTGKVYSSGAPVRQLRWASSIVEYVRSLYCGGDDVK